ncbi:MAG: urea ABC transporter permease subunit UrtB [Rhodospirillales bacterium]
MRFISGCFATFAVLLALATVAQAQSWEGALGGFAADSFTATEAAVAAMAASGQPRALDVIEALRDERLFHAHGKILLRTHDGAMVDAATGRAAPGTTADSLQPVRLNNRVRRAVQAALGSMTLLSADPARRYEAAHAVFKSKDATALETLDVALAKETDKRALRAMSEARAAIVLLAADTSAEAKLEAVAILVGRGDREAMALLRSLPAVTPPAVRDTAAKAAIAIENDLALWNVAQNAWYGLSLGSVLLLAAIGLAITFGVMGVINMAHGEMVMLGAYTTYAVQNAIQAWNPALLNYSLLASLPLAFTVAGLCGVLIERTIIRFLYGRPLETLLVTWGLSLVLQQAVRTVFGPTNREVGAPAWMSGAFELGQMSITYNRLWIICFASVVFVLLLVWLRYTRMGLEMRAVSQNRAMASIMGIRTGRVDALTFGFGSGIAGIAGVALSQIDNVGPNLGQSYIIDSFMVVVFGGVGNLWGTLVGALTLGMANKFLEPYAGAVLGKIVILIAIILFIQKRPRGMFALRGRAVEA